MIAGTYNILCEQGTTFGRVLDLQYPDPVDPEIYHPFDLQNFTARMQVRRTIDSTSTLVQLTTENGRIVLDEEPGRIRLIMDAATTAAITNSGVYDLEIIDAGGTVSRVVQGLFTLSQEVTR
jgi:hypothetical protein